MIVRIMSYNVGHYNMGLSEPGIPDGLLAEKLSNLKEMLMDYGPDFIGVQEDAHYIDRGNKKKSPEYVYAPVWRFRSGYKAETIRSKFAAVAGEHELMSFSNGQSYRRGVFKVNGKRLLFISAHTIAHVGNSAKRKAQYTELFDYIRSAMWDYCIVTGDFNTTEKVDKNNLEAVCKANGFSMAIGSYLPWLDTYMGRGAGQARHSFDNILTSKGVVIKTTKVLRDWYEKLYSDHVPVIADVEL